MDLIKYQQAVEWLFVQAPNYQKEGKKAYKPGLENIQHLCDFFNNPQEKLKTIHIAGTNGKGSTTHMLSSILQEAGYKVGIYTSPHLIDFSERIKVNGKNASKDFIFHFIQKLQNLPSHIRPSFFEFTTIMAFEYFYQEKVDFAIIETGLGGRLDSTNIITPLLCAITNVQLDHQDILGETLQEIAREKAGIIKKNIPIISGEENPSVQEILKEFAQNQTANFIDATQISSFFNSDLKGNYQEKNQKVVLALVKELQKLGLKISKENIENGLLNVQKNTHFIGRWFEFSTHPLTICDTGHNQAGLEKVFEQIKKINKDKHIILGFVQEKKIDEVLKFLPTEANYYFVKPQIFRGRNPQEYEHLLKENNLKYQLFQDVNEGYLSAKNNAKEEDFIFIGGSNFVVGDFLEKNFKF